MSFLRQGALAAALFAASCGWSTGLHLAPDHQSVGVDLFGNSTREPDLEREFHAELLSSVRNLVRAPIAAPDRADVVVRGELTEYRRRGGIRDRNNRLLESGLVISVSASLWDRKEGAAVAGPLSKRIPVGYSLDSSDGELDARRRAFHNLADRIVLELFAEATRTPQEEP